MGTPSREIAPHRHQHRGSGRRCGGRRIVADRTAVRTDSAVMEGMGVLRSGGYPHRACQVWGRQRRSRRCQALDDPCYPRRLLMPASSARRIAMPDQGIETLFGSFDETLKALESALNVKLKTSGHDVVVEGPAEDVARAERILEQLAGLLRDGYRFGKDDVKVATQLLVQNPDAELQEYFLRGT